MSERKVLNKYYPPDFDPSKIPRIKMAKNRQFTVRLMAPFNMRCATCGEYIYKGKKFNAKKEDVDGEEYLGIRIFRFYIKCTRCLQEISFKTDPKNTDYEIEAGATRNFMALKLAEEQAEKEEEERKEEEASNPMKLLENRTKQSKHELDILESLEELKDLNRRQQSVDYDNLLSQFSTKEAQEKIRKLQEEEDERFVRSIFGTKTVLEEKIVKDKPRKKRKKNKELDDIEIIEEPPKPVKDSLMSTKSENLFIKPLEGSSTSLGKLKVNMSNLVKVKKPHIKTEVKIEVKQEVESLSNYNKEINEKNVKKETSALSLLGSYSGSESE